DCDDTDPQSSNTANEICDGLDNDCNGLADYVATEGDGGSEDQDTDGDGSIDCADCADGDSSTFPGAPELCGDGIDNDCDPSTAAEVGDGTSAACAGSTCAQLLADGLASDDGVYWIDPPANPGDSLQVRCDMTTDGGGWTLVGVAIYANSGGAGWNDEGDLNLVSSTDLNAHWHLSSDRMNALATSGEYRALCFDSNNNYSRYWWGVTDYNWGALTTASESWDTYDRTGASYATAWSSGHYGLVSGSTEAVVVITAHNGNHWACAGSAGPGGEGFTGRGGVSNMRIWAK
ncbi:MAG: hypothetical protein CL928_06430, partial [Deltaproteobacteria bacterium]|nr:hypothetical protein [Deltaproteobacteria bacterium]